VGAVVLQRGEQCMASLGIEAPSLPTIVNYKARTAPLATRVLVPSKRVRTKPSKRSL
jgi:hypothetical protein